MVLIQELEDEVVWITSEQTDGGFVEVRFSASNGDIN